MIIGKLTQGNNHSEKISKIKEPTIFKGTIPRVAKDLEPKIDLKISKTKTTNIDLNLENKEDHEVNIYLKQVYSKNNHGKFNNSRCLLDRIFKKCLQDICYNY